MRSLDVLRLIIKKKVFRSACYLYTGIYIHNSIGDYFSFILLHDDVLPLLSVSHSDICRPYTFSFCHFINPQFPLGGII